MHQLEINQRIKEVRFYIENKTKSKLTQEEFATFLGITKSGVCDIERGRRNVTEQHIKLLLINCERAGVHLSEDWLRYGKGTIERDMTREEEIVSWAANITNSDDPDNFMLKFAYMLTQLDEEEWKLLEKMTEVLLSAKKG